MPQRKQPPTLRNICMQKVREMLLDVLGRWIGKLCLGERSSPRSCRYQLREVKEECLTVKEFLTTLPIYILDDLLPLVVSDFVKELSSRVERERGFERFTRRDIQMDNAVCRNLLTSVLFSSTKRLNVRITNSFEQSLVIQTLNSTPNLTKLVFNTGEEFDNSSLLASNIHHLTQLVSFTYTYRCTDRVVQQLTLHCRKLEEIDVSNSAAVTNASVEHLKKIKDLSYVSVMRTSVTTESYGLLISELPKLANINWSSPICNVLNSISSESLHNIKFFNGCIYDTRILTRKCPNITILKLMSVDGNLSSLGELNKLVELRIKNRDYLLSNMVTVLQGVGHRLERLHLYSVTDVNMYDIVTLCSCLLSLSIDYCTTVPTDFYTTVNRDLRHFQSLNSLIIVATSVSEGYNILLGYYVNLEEFMCGEVEFLSHDSVAQAVQNGGFRCIKHFDVLDSDVGDLSMDTVRLLLDTCVHLKTLGTLTSWNRVSAQNIRHLKSRVRSENLDLTLIEV
jgi:hypothetical protein